MMIADFEKDIRAITVLLIEKELTLRENFPSRSGDVLTWSQKTSPSHALRSKRYYDIYKTFFDNQQYNVLLIDGGLIQLDYKFEKDEVVKHRLAYYPKPFDFVINDARLISHSRQLVPLRFDYDKNVHKSYFHSKSHLTLGNQEDSRISVSTIVTPKQFIFFILNAFYANTFREKGLNVDFFLCSHLRNFKYLTSDEKKVLHISVN